MVRVAEQRPLRREERFQRLEAQPEAKLNSSRVERGGVPQSDARAHVLSGLDSVRRGEAWPHGVVYAGEVQAIEKIKGLED